MMKTNRCPASVSFFEISPLSFATSFGSVLRSFNNQPTGSADTPFVEATIPAGLDFVRLTLRGLLDGQAEGSETVTLRLLPTGPYVPDSLHPAATIGFRPNT